VDQDTGDEELKRPLIWLRELKADPSATFITWKGGDLNEAISREQFEISLGKSSWKISSGRPQNPYAKPKRKRRYLPR